MKWFLIVTIVAFGGHSSGGVHSTVQKIGIFDTLEECKEAGKVYKKDVISDGYVRVHTTCIQSYIEGGIK